MFKYYSSDGWKLKRTNDEAAGYDICSSEDILLRAKESFKVKTGIHYSIPKGYAFTVWPRSGLSVKYDIERGAGLLDSDYRGEVVIKLYNFGDIDYYVKAGERIAQLVLQKVELVEFDQVRSLDALGGTDRGTNGFGSTGK